MINQKYSSPHPQARQTVTVVTKTPLFQQKKTTVQYVVDDWWIRAAGMSWGNAQGNPACLNYAMRGAIEGLPDDDDVVYGHTPDGLGHLVHVSEITEVVSS